MFNDIRSIIPKAIERAGLTKKIGEVDLFEICSNVISNYLDESEQKKVRPVFLRDNVLIMASLSDMATQKVKQNEQKIIANIKEKTGADNITEIKILT